MILKSPCFRGFFFAFLLGACNRHQTPSPTSSSDSPEAFTYTAPNELIEALRTVAGYEDSHAVPGHENLRHEHSSPESWTTKEAIEDMAKMAKMAKHYHELNQNFEMIIGKCLIPDHHFHSYSLESGMKHYSNNTKLTGKFKKAVLDLEKVKNADWVMLFKDRILIFIWTDQGLAVKEKILEN